MINPKKYAHDLDFIVFYGSQAVVGFADILQGYFTGTGLGFASEVTLKNPVNESSRSLQTYNVTLKKVCPYVVKDLFPAGPISGIFVL